MRRCCDSSGKALTVVAGSGTQLYPTEEVCSTLLAASYMVPPPTSSVQFQLRTRIRRRCAASASASDLPSPTPAPAPAPSLGAARLL